MKRLLRNLAVVLGLAMLPRAAGAQTYFVSGPNVGTAPAIPGQVWTPLAMSDDDEGTGTITFPGGFTFIHYNKAYTSVDVAANGLLIFGNTTGACRGLSSGCNDAQNIPATASPNATVAFWWADMDFSSSASDKVSYSYSGTAPNRTLSIRLRNWGEYDYSSTAGLRTVQLDLAEQSGSVRVWYGAITRTTGSTEPAAVGIEDATGTIGVVGLPCSNTTSRCRQTDWPDGKYIDYAPSTDFELAAGTVTGSALTPATVGGQPGFELDVTATVRNLGRQPATGVTFNVYLCTVAQVVTNDPSKCTLLRSHAGAETVAAYGSATFTEHAVQFARPAGTGNFYIGVYFDPANAITEAMEGNNGALSSAYVIGSELTGDVSGPTAGGPGDPVEVRVVLKNRGTDAAGAFTYELYLSSSRTLDANSAKFLTQTVTGLAAGETQDVLVPATLPGVVNGSYYYVIKVDTTNAVAEANETDNQVASTGQIAISASDLVVENLQILSAAAGHPPTSDAYFGEKLWVKVDVANRGGASARNFDIVVVLSDNSFISPLQDVVVPATSEPLVNLTWAGNESHTLQFEVDVPAMRGTRPLPDGNYYLGVVVDAWSRVAENNENNNKIATLNAIRVRQPAMDLMPVRVEAPAAAGVGELMPVRRVVRNIGNRGNVGGTPFQYQYVLSSNDVISVEDIKLKIVVDGVARDFGTGEAAAGGDSESTDLVQLPADITPGAYYVGVLADPAGAVAELDETNNAAASLSAVEVAASSLRIETASLPDALVGVDYLQQLVASGGAGLYTWSVEDPAELPAGMALSAEGMLSGRPSAASTSVFTVRVSSGARGALARLVLRAVEVSGPLAVLTTRLPSAVRGADYAVDLAAVGGVRPYTWIVAEGAPPDGLALTQAGKLQGKLARAYPEPVTFKVAALDAFGSRAEGAVTMRAIEPGSLYIAMVKLGDALVGVPYMQQLQAIGPDSALAWRIASGVLPNGLKLVAGSITGTPVAAGMFPLRVEVSDSLGHTDTADVVLNVLPRPATFNPVVAPEARPGERYSLDLAPNAALGAVFTIWAGALPAGLTMTPAGYISGTVDPAAEARSYDTVLEITEEAGASALYPLTIRVVAKPASGGGDDGGCSTAGGGRAPLGLALLALVAFAGRSRRRVAGGLVAAAALVLAPSAAHAGYVLTPPKPAPFAQLVGGTPVTLASASAQQAVPLPFNFRIYGTTFTTVNVGCRGYLAFGGSAAVGDSKGIPATATSYPIVAPWWGNWDCNPDAVTYRVGGVAPFRVLTFQWENVWYYRDAPAKASHGATFQARLHETTGQVEFAYGRSDQALYTDPMEIKVAVGVQGPGGVSGMAGLPCTSRQAGTLSGANCSVQYDYPYNKVITFTQPPDVSVARLYGDEIGYAGAPMRMGASVFNDGGYDALKARVRFFLSTTPTLNDSLARDLGATLPIDVGVGQKRDVALSPVLPADLTEATYYLFARVALEPDNTPGSAQLLEENTANNQSAAYAFTLGAKTGDLAVGAVTVPATASAGGTITVGRTIQNVGSRLLGPCAADAECGELACNQGRCRAVCTSDAQCPSGQTCDLARGKCDTGTCSAGGAACPAGEQCDAGGKCVASPVQYALYLSDNPVITLADARLAPPGVAALAGGLAAFSDHSANETVTLPAGLAPGRYYVGVIVDPAALQPEISEANNSLASEGFIVSNGAPQILTATLPDAVMYAPYGVQLQASGGNGTYVFALTAGSTLPAGLGLTSAGRISGTPTVAQDAPYGFEVEVSSGGQTARKALTLAVRPSALPLNLLTRDLPAGAVGQPYSVRLTAVGGRGPYTWSLSSGAILPLGLALGADGTLEGIPGHDGTFSFQVEVRDAAGASAAQPLTLWIAAPDRMRISTPYLPDGFLGKHYEVALTVSGGRAPFLWMIADSHLLPSDPTDLPDPSSTEPPPGLMLTNDVATGARLSGVPLFAGTYAVTIKVQEASGAEDNATFLLTVRYEQGLAIDTQALPDAIVGKTYQARLVASGGENPVAWAVTCVPTYNEQGGLLPCRQTLPPGFSLGADGAITTGEALVEPPAADEQGNVAARTSYSFLVRAQDVKGRTALRGLSITVRRDDPPPTPESTCQTGLGAAGLVEVLALVLLGLLAMRRRSHTSGGAAMLVLAAALSLSNTACSEDPPPGRCDNVTCAAPLECDTADGVCKCGGQGGLVCGEKGVCGADGTNAAGAPSYRCIYACGDVKCPVVGTALDASDCTCKCGGPGGPACQDGQVCDPATRVCAWPGLCQGVTCPGGTVCDGTDGVCKCGGVACGAGQACRNDACVDDPCAATSCSGGTVCNPADAACHCGGVDGDICTAGQSCLCPGGAAICAEADRRCAETNRCLNVQCDGGTTCDPADGKCRCGGPGGPECLFGQSCDVRTRSCLGGQRCAGVSCGEGMTCDPEDGVCKCGGVAGLVCQTGQICVSLNDKLGNPSNRCVMPCDPREQHCAAGQGCYYDIVVQKSFCATAGTKTEGMGCTAATECDVGMHCQQDLFQSGICRHYCNVPDRQYVGNSCSDANPCPGSGLKCDRLTQKCVEDEVCPQIPNLQSCQGLSGATDSLGACDLSG